MIFIGRYLAAGIPARIHIYCKSKNFDKSRLKKLYEKLSKYISMDLYSHKEYDTGDLFVLKDISKEEIYKTLCEFKKVTEQDYTLFPPDDEYSSLEEILSNDFKFKIVYGYEKYGKNGRKYNGYFVNENFREFDIGFYTELWLLRDCDLTGSFDYEVDIHIEYFDIWMDIDKIDSEDETTLLAILNKFKIKSFANCSELTKSILFYISG